MIHKAVAGCRYQMIFSGGFGGVVSYDGKGGPLTKDGAPFDRIHLVRPFDDLGNVGLALFNAKMTFSSGDLLNVSKVRSGSQRTRQDTHCVFRFKSNSDSNAIVIVGEVPVLNLKHGSILFSGTTNEFEMLWYAGDITGKLPGVPLQAQVTQFSVHPDILQFFGLPSKITGFAIGLWDKPTKNASAVEALRTLRDHTEYGIPISTQQEVASVHIFVE
jgi:hypothetical protein